MVFRSVRGCPVCGDAFSIFRAQDYSYETCSDCHGIWMSRSTLETLAAGVHPGAKLVLEPVTASAERERSCPDCHRPMNKAAVSRVPVDVCSDEEHGIWFDGTELRQVLERVGDDEPPPPELPSNFRSLLGDFFRRSGS